MARTLADAISPSTKPSREQIEAAAAAAVMVVDVVAVVVVTAVVAAVIAITIAMNANPAGSKPGAADLRRSVALLTRLRNYLQTQPLSGSHYFNHIFLSGFHLAQRVGVVVNVFHVASTNLDDTVTLLDAGFRRR